MVLDRELSGTVVAEIIRTCLRDREGLAVMARSAKALAKPDAASRLADLVTQTARRAPGAGSHLFNQALRREAGSCKHV